MSRLYAPPPLESIWFFGQLIALRFEIPAKMGFFPKGKSVGNLGQLVRNLGKAGQTLFFLKLVRIDYPFFHGIDFRGRGAYNRDFQYTFTKGMPTRTKLGCKCCYKCKHLCNHY